MIVARHQGSEKTNIDTSHIHLQWMICMRGVDVAIQLRETYFCEAKPHILWNRIFLLYWLHRLRTCGFSTRGRWKRGRLQKKHSHICNLTLFWLKHWHFHREGGRRQNPYISLHKIPFACTITKFYKGNVHIVSKGQIDYAILVVECICVWRHVLGRFIHLTWLIMVMTSSFDMAMYILTYKWCLWLSF